MKSGDIGLQHEGSVHDQKRPLFVPSRLILVLKRSHEPFYDFIL
jgi:hypothetical protein